MNFDKIEQTKNSHKLDQTDRNMCIKQTKRTEKWILARSNTTKYGYWPDKNIGIKQAEMRVCPVANRPVPGY